MNAPLPCSCKPPCRGCPRRPDSRAGVHADSQPPPPLLPRVAALRQPDYLTDSANNAGLIASERSPSGRLWARARDSAAESGALTALAARAEAAAQEAAAQTDGSGAAPHYKSVEAGALASIAAQARAQLRLSNEQRHARDAQRHAARQRRSASARRHVAVQAAESARQPAADMSGHQRGAAPQRAGSAASRAVRDARSEPARARARRKLQQRQKQLERIARLDDELTAERRVQRKEQRSQVLHLKAAHVPAAAKGMSSAGAESAAKHANIHTPTASGHAHAHTHKLQWPGETGSGAGWVKDVHAKQNVAKSGDAAHASSSASGCLSCGLISILYAAIRACMRARAGARARS